MIGYPRRSVTRRVIDDALADIGVAPRVDMEMGAPDAMKRLVEVGLGFSLLPENLVRADIRRGRLVTFDVRGLAVARTLGFVRSESTPATPAADAFRDMAFARLKRAKRKG